MKTVIIALLAVAGCNAFVARNILDEVTSRRITPEMEALTGKALEEYLNANQRFFTAKDPEWSQEKMRSRVMDKKFLEKTANAVIPPFEFINDASIPDSFDSRNQWPNCPTINDIRDQSDCGSCWAFGAAEAISDRICIASNGATSVRISPEDLLSCCGISCGEGCQGGYPLRAWKYFNSKGLVTGGLYGDTTTCRPYSLAPCGGTGQVSCPKDGYNTPACDKECIPQYTAQTYPNDKHFGASAYSVAKSVSAIQKEILTYGPVEAAYTVYEDFYQYTGGVYVHTAGKEVGGHAVKIIGWGSDNGTPYWLVANSWGNTWGESGYFRILRGADECGIEDGIVAGHPKV